MDGDEKPVDPRRWYFMENGVEVDVPKRPILNGMPDFTAPGSITLWDGRVREIRVDHSLDI